MRTRARLPAASSVLPYAWSVLLALLLLGPALGRGFVLSYDMVWVPDLALTRDALGVGSGLPRAVPSDAVVAVLDQLLPGALLQKVVLLGVLVGAGTGALRLVPDLPLAARLVAVTAVQWNPFVAERLVMGHWPVLVTYAVLPWIVVVARSGSGRRPVPGPLWLLVPLASLSASGGLAAAVLVLATCRPRHLRGWASLLGLLVAANAPWLVSGLLHAGAATTDAAGGAAFALAGEGTLPGPLAALGLGGIWNAEVAPASMTGPAGWVFVLLLVVLAALGARPWWSRTRRREGLGLVAAWSVGWGLAVLTWGAPGVLAWVGAHVPGAGLLRDGSRLLVLCVPLLVQLVAYGAAELGRRSGPVLDRAGPLRLTAAAVLVVLPVTLLPDLALGVSGRLRTADYPREYATVRALVASGGAGDGDVLLLPFSSYRQPSWNHAHKVLDPIGRYLGRDVVASDVLVVSGRAIAGEDPRAARVARLLAAGDAPQRARRLAALGVGTVVVDRAAPGGAPGQVPAVAGDVVHDGPLLQVVRLDGVRPAGVPGAWWWAMGAAWAAYAGGLLWGALAVAGQIRGRRLRRNATPASARC